MTSRGWPVKSAFLMLVAGCSLSLQALAGSLTIRDIQTKANQVEIQLDGALPRNAIDLDYVRDIVQFSVQSATLYPAKIIHAENQTFSKIFAYQYSPNMVRVRFSVEGASEQYKGKVKWQQKGKSVIITFPESTAMAPAKNPEAQEKSLIAKVMSAAKRTSEKSETKSDVKVEKITAEAAREEKDEQREPREEKNHEEKAHLTGSHPNGEAHLSGMKNNGPSVLRSFLAMFLVVGGLGLVLVYVKKKKGAVQAKKVGDSWFSSLIPDSMKKQKSFIEVLAQHPIGPKQSLIVVKVRGQQFVLGVTQDNVQLISQLDADEAELDLLDDPIVAASIGKMFGGKPTVAPVAANQKATEASFNSMLKQSNGAGAIVARNSYQTAASQGPRIEVGLNTAVQQAHVGLTQVPEIKAQQNGIRDQIRRRLEGMKSV